MCAANEDTASCFLSASTGRERQQRQNFGKTFVLFSSDLCFFLWFVLRRRIFFLRSFFFISCETSQFFFFQDVNTAITYSLRFEKEPLLLCDDDALKEQQQQQQQQQHATTTAKESTSEKSGEREDGFEGTRERRTFGVCAFEDS